jgi:hypothetical protein
MTFAITKPLPQNKPAIVIDIRDGIDLTDALHPELNPHDLIWPQITVVNENTSSLPKDHRWNVGDAGQRASFRCNECDGEVVTNRHCELVCQNCGLVFDYLATSEHLNGKSQGEDSWTVTLREQPGTLVQDWAQPIGPIKKSWWNEEDIKILKEHPSAGIRQLGVWIEGSRAKGMSIGLLGVGFRGITNNDKRKVVVGNASARDLGKRDIVYLRTGYILQELDCRIEDLQNKYNHSALETRKKFRELWSERYGAISVQNVEAKVRSFVNRRNKRSDGNEESTDTEGSADNAINA